MARINKKYKNVCNVCTEYSLFLYLLFMPIEEIRETFYIFNPYGINEKIIRRIPDSYVMPNYNKWNVIKKVYITLFGWLHFRLIKLAKIPNFDGTSIYGNDISRYDAVIIGNHPYSLIEDGAGSIEQSYIGFFKKFDDKKQASRFYPILRMLNGPTYFKRFGTNSLCTDVYSTSSIPPSLIKDKKLHLMNLRDLWDKCSQEKIFYILKIFDIEEKDIKELTSRKTIIFTQPLFPDFISLSEHSHLYSKLLMNYDCSSIVIKTHPRDNYPYERLNKDVFVFRKNVPSQLLELIGVRYERAVTFFSSAVKSIAYPIKIDWYGTGGNRTIMRNVGHIIPPVGVKELKLQE